MNRRSFVGAMAASTASFSAATPKIRVGIVGVQHSHLSGKVRAMLDNPNYELAAVCEPDEATRRAHANDKLLKPLRWMPLDDLLGDASIRLIVFEGEVKDAVPLGMRALNAGKHLHLEKPPANRMEPFRELVETARRRKLVLQLGYLWRYHAGTDAALEAYRNGWLGEVYMIRGTINSDRDAPQRAVEARFRGGSMFELGGHLVDRVVAFLGRPGRVQHWLRHDTTTGDNLNDNTLAVFEYKNAVATVVSSAKDPAMNRHFEVIGTDGTIIINPMEPAPKLRANLRVAKGPFIKGWHDMQLAPQPRFVRDFEELARAIQTGSELKYSYDHELLLHETLLRASGEVA